MNDNKGYAAYKRMISSFGTPASEQRTKEFYALLREEYWSKNELAPNYADWHSAEKSRTFKDGIGVKDPFGKTYEEAFESNDIAGFKDPLGLYEVDKAALDEKLNPFCERVRNGETVNVRELLHLSRDEFEELKNRLFIIKQVSKLQQQCSDGTIHGPFADHPIFGKTTGEQP